jgi:S-methylmethionine-dependent homocysteine/selenocysteine methylase
MVADVDSVIAAGVNCTAPAAVGPAVAAAAAAGRPVVAYPNSGETWDAGARRWIGAPGISPDDVPPWITAGVRLVGGCCRVRPSDVQRIARMIR